MANRESKFVVSAENRASPTLQKVAKEFDGLGSAATRTGVAFKAFAATTAAALGSAFSLAAIKATVDRLDDLSKAAQRAGMSSEAFSQLAYAGELADVSMQDLQGSMGKLAKSQGDAARGTAEQANAFKALGIEYKNADGTLRATNDVFLDFADRFQELQGSPEIIAVGMQLFGRSFQNLIPLLKDGSAGLKATGEEARLFGLVLDAETGRRAEAFNDNLTRMGSQLRGFAQIVTTEALEPAVQFTDELVKIGVAALNAEGGVRDLAADGTLKSWAQTGAVALATIGESLVFLGRAAHTVAGSFRAVWADIEVASAASRNLFGGFLFESNRKALQDALKTREGVVRDANERLLDLINYDGAKLSRALRESFANAGATATATGGAPSAAQSEAAKRLEALRKLLESLRSGGSGGKKAARFEQADLTDEQRTLIAAIGLYTDIEKRAKDYGLTLEWLDRLYFDGAISVGQYDAAMQQLTKSSQTFGADGEKVLDDLAAKWKDLIDPTREYQRQLDEIRKLVATGKLSKDQGIAAEFEVESKRNDDMLGGMADKTKEAGDAARELGFTFQSAFEDAIIEGKKFSDVLAGIGQDLLRMTIRKSITEPAANWLSSALNLGSLFGGAKSHATGLDYVPYDNYPAILHKGERVQTAAEARRGGSGAPMTFAPTLNVYGEMSRSQEARLMAMMQNVAAGTVHQMKRQRQIA